jgi:aspartate-semialdehyde dehydrogenase
MVGSVLLERMRAEGDFKRIETTFFSTSQKGQPGPDVGDGSQPLLDADDPAAFRGLDAVVSCQGGDYTHSIHPRLRKAGFDGYWIDAARALRMEPDAVIILDPVNRRQIDDGLKRGLKDFIGGNCTVSLMLMAVAGLYEQGWVEWVNASTYQAASGAGAKNMRELLSQMKVLGDASSDLVNDPASSILDIDRTVTKTLAGSSFPKAAFGAALAGSLIPWIDAPVETGQTREEWKAHVESNKILGLDPEVPVDGICVRIGAMRCHSQALTIKLRKDVPLDELQDAIGRHNDWVKVVPNDKPSTLEQLSPAHVSGTLQVPIGRLHKLRLGPEYLSAFTVGDQLLWGAAEPLRRMLTILLENR